jgi:hypothetical protein
VTWGVGGALGGTRTPSLLIRRYLSGGSALCGISPRAAMIVTRLSGLVHCRGKLFVWMAPSGPPFSALAERYPGVLAS